MAEQKTIKEATVLEIKAALFDMGVQIETIQQQRNALINELLDRQKTEQPKIKTETEVPTEAPVEAPVEAPETKEE